MGFAFLASITIRERFFEHNMSSPIAYLTLEQAKYRLGQYKFSSSLPNDEELVFLLESVEAYIDNWLDRRLAVTRYVESLLSSGKGSIVLSNSPVINVVQVNRLYMMPISQSTVNIQARRADPIGMRNQTTREVLQYWFSWDGEITVYVNEFDRYEIEYYAGYIEIPRIVSECTFLILKGTLQNGGFDFLLEATKDITSLSLPGSLSQSFKRGNQSTEELNQLSRYLSQLDRYRKKLIY